MSDITVAMPDGKVIAFPSGTDKDTIQRVAHDYATKQSPASPPQARQPAGGGATPPASPSQPSRQQIDDYRLKYFNTDNDAANIPKATAAALAKDPNNADTLKRLSRMSPVGQAAIREHAGEIKAENDRTQAYIHSFDGGASPQVMAESLHAIAGGGGFVNPVQQQSYKAQQVPGFDPSAAFKGPEGAKQGKMTGHGALDPSLNVLADFAAFGATPEGAAFGEAMGTIGMLGEGAADVAKTAANPIVKTVAKVVAKVAKPKVATGAAVAMGEMDAVNRYRKGDKQGAATSAVLGVLPLGIHGVAERLSAKAEARKAIANEQAAGNGTVGAAATPGADAQGLGQPVPAVPAASDTATSPGSVRGSDHPSADTSKGPDAHLLRKVVPKEGATEAQKQEIAAHNAAIEAKRNFSIDPEKGNQNVQEVRSGIHDSSSTRAEDSKSVRSSEQVGRADKVRSDGDGRKAGNINLEYIDAPEDVKSHILEVAKTNAAMDEARGGVISHEETVRAAREIGITEEELNDYEPGQRARIVTAVRDLHAKASAESESAKQAWLDDPTPENYAAHQEALSKYQSIQAATAGHTAEAGRALNAFKILADERRSKDFTPEGVLQRMQLNDPSLPVSPEEHAKVDPLVKDYAAKGKAIEEYDKGAPEREEAESKAAVEEAVEKLKPKKTRVGRTPEQRAKVKADILTERADIHTRIQRKLSGLNSVVDAGGVIVKILPEIRDLAGNLVKEGVLKADELVDKVHEHIKQYAPDATRRQVADAISGYGHASPIPRATRLADIKEQLRLTSQIEDIHARVSNTRTKRPVSPEVQALREQKSQALADQRGKPVRRGFPRQTVDQRVRNYQKALENKINGYERRIQTRDFSKRPRNPLPLDDHTRELIKNRDQLKAIYESIKPKTPYDPADTNRLQRLTKQFETIDARHQQHIFGERKPAPRADTPEEAAMRAKLTASNQQEKAMQAAKGAYVDPFAKQKATMQKQIADMQRQITAGEPDPHIDNRQARPMDAEGERLKAARKEVGRRLNQMIDARKPKTAADKFLSYRRFAALSHLTTLGKLGAAAAKRVFLTSPMESAAGAITRRLPVLSRIAEKAPEGTPTMRAQKRAFSTMKEKATFESSMQKLKTSVNHLDLAYGDAKHVEEESLASWAGRLHGAIKTPAQIAEFNKSMSIQEDFYRKQGIDTSDPATQALMATKAYATSREAILMQDNAVTSAFYEAVNSLERSKNPTARGTAVIAKAAIPIAKVPSNYVGEALLKTPGVGLIRLAPLLGRSVESLTPAEADLVMKVFRKQGVGLAMATAGWIAYNRVGGNYLPHKKPEPGGPDIGAYKTPLGNLSHTWNHSADDDVVMMAADAHRAIEHDRQRGENLLTQLGSGGYAAGVGTASDVPFVDVVNKLARAQESSSAFGTMVGEEGTGMVIPGIVPDIAQFLDKDKEGNVRKRKVRGFGDAIKYGIGARSLLEEKR